MATKPSLWLWTDQAQAFVYTLYPLAWWLNQSAVTLSYYHWLWNPHHSWDIRVSVRISAHIFLRQLHLSQCPSAKVSSWLFSKQQFCLPEPNWAQATASQFWSSEILSPAVFEASTNSPELRWALVATRLRSPELLTSNWPAAGSSVKRAVTLIVDKSFLPNL